MKTLKKTLCLILAVVMVVGVLILPANAASIKDYKDNEDIKYKEAVEVLSGLGILGGKDTGYFAPKGTLNRAEAAKIIAWMLLGKDAEKLHSNTQIFADVAADNWAAGYIAFCKNEGILAGDGTGNFRPNGELNGVDFGKMLLTALGYDAKLEGYVLNKDWDKNIIAQMLNKNSYIDIGTVLSNPMTREEAAQMAFLALQQSTVKYPTTIHGTSQSVLTGTTLGAQVFGLTKIEGEITAVGRTAGTATIAPFDYTAENAGEVETPYTVKGVDTPWTDIGYGGYVWGTPASTIRDGKTYDAVSDVYVTGKSLKATTDGTDITRANVRVASNARVYFNGEYVGKINSYNNSGAVPANVTTGPWWNQTTAPSKDNIDAAAIINTHDNNVGVKVDYICNDNGGEAEVVVVTEYTTAYVTGIANESNTGTDATLRNSYRLDPVNVAGASFNVPNAKMVTSDALDVGDLVTYVEYPNSRNNNVQGDYYVTEAGMTNGTYTRMYRATVAGQEILYVIGGNEYIISDYEDSQTLGRASTYLNNTANLNKSTDVYTDPYGYILLAGPASTASEYLYVLGNNVTVGTTGLTDATVVTTAGEILNIQIDRVAGYANDAAHRANALAGHAYAFTVNANGTYNLTIKDSDLEDTAYIAKSATLDTMGVNLRTVVIDVRGVNIRSTSADVYTGYNEIPTVYDGNWHYFTMSNGRGTYVTYAFLDSGRTSLSDSFIVYDTSVNYTEVVGGNRYYYLDVIVNHAVQENYQLTATEYLAIDTYGVGEYAFNTDGTLAMYTAFPESDEWAQVIDWGNGTVRTSKGYYTYDDASVAFHVLDITDGEADKYSMVFGDDAYAYVKYSSNGRAVDAIYIVSGRLASIPTTPAHSYNTVRGDSLGKYYDYYVADGYITNYKPADTITVRLIDSMGHVVGEKTVRRADLKAGDSITATLNAAGKEIDTSAGTSGVVASTTNGADKTITGATVNATSGTVLFDNITADETVIDIEVRLKDAAPTGIDTTLDDTTDTYQTANSFKLNAASIATGMSFESYISQFTGPKGGTVKWTFYPTRNESAPVIITSTYKADGTLDNWNSTNTATRGEDMNTVTGIIAKATAQDKVTTAYYYTDDLVDGAPGTVTLTLNSSSPDINAFRKDDYTSDHFTENSNKIVVPAGATVYLKDVTGTAYIFTETVGSGDPVDLTATENDGSNATLEYKATKDATIGAVTAHKVTVTNSSDSNISVPSSGNSLDDVYVKENTSCKFEITVKNGYAPSDSTGSATFVKKGPAATTGYTVWTGTVEVTSGDKTVTLSATAEPLAIQGVTVVNSAVQTINGMAAQGDGVYCTDANASWTTDGGSQYAKNNIFVVFSTTGSSTSVQFTVYAVQASGAKGDPVYTESATVAEGNHAARVQVIGGSLQFTPGGSQQNQSTYWEANGLKAGKYMAEVTFNGKTVSGTFTIG